MNVLPILVAAMVFAQSRCEPVLSVCGCLRREAAHARADHDDGLAETMGGLILRCDGSGSVMSVSSNCAALFGVPPGALMGHGFFERVQVADRPAFLKAISDARAGSVTVKTTLRWRGSVRVNRGDYAEPVFLWLEMRARHGKDANLAGKRPGPMALSSILRDVSEAKRHEIGARGGARRGRGSETRQGVFPRSCGP